MSRVRVPSLPPHINSGRAKAPNIGIEVSEIMAAAAMLMKPSKLDEYHNDGFKGLVQFIKEAKLLAGSKKFVFGLGLQTKAMKAFQGQNGKDILRAYWPEAGRVVVFDSRIPHVARSVETDKFRVSLVFKGTVGETKKPMVLGEVDPKDFK